MDVRREALHPGERDEVARDRALAKEDDGRRTGEPDALELHANGRIERGVRLSAADRDAEPDRPHRAGRGRDAVDGLRDAPVLRDLGAREHADQDGRPDRDPDGGEERARRTAANPAERKADDVHRCPHAVAFRRR